MKMTIFLFYAPTFQTAIVYVKLVVTSVKIFWMSEIDSKFIKEE